MKVFKFGGASVKDAAHILNVVSIIEKYKSDDLVIIVSAMGKTTNFLEEVWDLYLKGLSWKEALSSLKNDQHSIIDEIFSNPAQIKSNLDAFYQLLIEFLEANNVKDGSYLYDQIISIGEITSSFILSSILNEKGIINEYLHAKSLVRTDLTFREGKVDWKITEEQICAKVKSGIYVTQGFVGGTENEQNTTLGREGSDYSAAIFAYCLNADSVTVWKDVNGILNADPRLVTDTELIEEMSYEQAILLTHYGAKVIHPKTIEPLKNKSIKLFVRSYNNLQNNGTCVSEKEGSLPAIFIKKEDQIVMKVIAEKRSLHPHDLSDILFLMKETQLAPYFIKYTPNELLVSCDNQQFKLEKLIKNLPASLKLEGIMPVEMGVYHAQLEGAPLISEIYFLQDDGNFRIILGKF